MVDLSPGTTLGPYTIVGLLGRGGMATVYRAHHAALDRDVAVKVVWPSIAEAPGFIERFQNEARAVSRLRHPNILNIYDFGRQDGTVYMVTELLPGGTLADRLGRPLSLAEAVDVARGVGAALDYAHGQGIVHRDVKPSNILFGADGTPVLADFGIARMWAESEQLTSQGTPIGTPEYMSPEQAVGSPVGPPSDLYSLGVVLYQMVTGAAPFRQETAVATLRAQAEEPLPSPRLANPSLPPGLDAVLERALAKRPEDRYRSGVGLANAFATAVERATERPMRQPGAAGPMDRTMVVGPEPTQINVGYVDPTGVMPVQRRSRVVPALMGLLAVSLAAGIMAFLFRAIWSPQPGPPPTPTRILEGAQPGGTGPTAIAIATLAPPASAPPPPTIQSAAPTAPLAVASPEPTVQVAAPSPEPTVLAVAPPSEPTAAPSPVVVVLPTPTTAVPPTSPPAPKPTDAAKPTAPLPPAPPPATVAPTRAAPGGAQPPGQLTAQITSPANNAQVPALATVEGRLSGALPANQHLWMFIQPRGSNDNWWPHPEALVTDDRGQWRVRNAGIGGPAGSAHTIVVGVVDEATHQQLQREVTQRPGQPLSGLPAGFSKLAEVPVTKGG